MKQIWMITALCSVLGACGGGSAVGGSTNATGSTDYAFFLTNSSSGYSLNAYDPDATSGSGITTIPTSNLSYSFAITSSYLNGINASNVHQAQVMFVDGNQFKAVSTAKSDKLAVRTLSDYKLQGIVCSPVRFYNYLVFTDSGSDGTCGNSNDSGVQAVSTSMSSSDPIITLASVPIAVAFSDSNAVLGLISLNNGNLEFSNANATTTSNLLPGVTVTSATLVGEVGSLVLLNVDGGLRIIDGSKGSISAARYTPGGTLSNVISDGSNFYFFDNGKMISLAMDGKSPATQVPNATASGTPELHFVHKQYLVFTDASSGGTSINAVQLAAPNNTGVLVAMASGLTYSGHSGDYVYYNVSGPNSSSDFSGNMAGVAKYDTFNGAPRTLAGANWNGWSYDTSVSASEGPQLNSLVLEQYNFQPGTVIPAGGNISVYDAATDTLRNSQASLPPGVLMFTGGLGFGAHVYGRFFGNGYYYFAGLNVNTAQSMYQIDNSVFPVNDYLIF